MKFMTTLALGVALLAPLGSALAQDDTMKVLKPVRVLAGIFNASEGINKQRLSVGVGYDIKKTTAGNPTVYGLFLDHNTKKSNGVTTSMTAFGVSGRFYLESANASGKPYALVGLGNYSVRSQVTFDNSVGTSSRAIVTESVTKNRFGGKLGIGYEMNEGFLVEADYNFIQKIEGFDPSGFNIRLGYRF